MGILWAIQFVVTAVCCAFYFCMSNRQINPARRLTLDSQLFSGPLETWSGMYRRAETRLGRNLLGRPHLALLRFRQFLLFFSFPSFSGRSPVNSQFGLALLRSIKSLEVKQMGLWKLMLRDGLNLYGVRLTPFFP